MAKVIMGSQTADGAEPAGADQIAGRVHACLDYLLHAAGRGDMVNVRAWVGEIRGLVDYLAEPPAEVANVVHHPRTVTDCHARIPGTQNLCTRYAGHPGDHRCNAGDVDRGLAGQMEDDRRRGLDRTPGPSNFRVVNRAKDEDHGIYSTLDEARGCVEFDCLEDYEIWQGDHIVEEREREPNGQSDTPGWIGHSRAY